MKGYKLLRKVMIATRADRIWLGFAVFFLICTTVFWLNEPHIKTWGDSAWYAFSLVSTCGFGDVIVYSPVSRILSVLLSVYAVIVIAILTAVVVSFYKNLMEYRLKHSMSDIIDRIENLPELSKEELQQLVEDFHKMKISEE